MSRRLVVIAAAVTSMLVELAASCTSHPNDSRSTPSVGRLSPSSVSSPSAPASTAVSSPPASTASSSGSGTQPAVDAFTAYITATYNAQKAPRQPGQAYASAADFTRNSFDPMRTQENAYIASLAANGQAFRGTAPKPRVHVSQSDLAAKPYPMVVLTNCPTPAPTWVAYDTRTGKPVAYAPAKVPPPYLATVTLIFYEGHWGVQKISVDTRRTCTG